MICKKCGYDFEGEICPMCHNKVSANKNSPYGLIGMILSICSWTMKIINYVISLFIPFVPNIPDFPFAVAGLVLSVVGRDKNKSDGMATTGIILSSIKIGVRCVSELAAWILTLISTLICALVIGAILLISIAFIVIAMIQAYA